MRIRAHGVRAALAIGGVLVLASMGGGAQGPSTPTFSETIAPIVYGNCVTCHRPGEAAPFSLLTYEDVAKRGKLIAKVTSARYMPPWHAAPGFGEFVGERRLSDQDHPHVSSKNASIATESRAATARAASASRSSPLLISISR